MQELSCPGCQISGGWGVAGRALESRPAEQGRERRPDAVFTGLQPCWGRAAVAGGRPGQGGWRRLPRTPG